MSDGYTGRCRPATAEMIAPVLVASGYWQDEEGWWHSPDEAVSSTQHHYANHDGARAAGGDNLGERARKYVLRMPESVSGSGGHDAAWQVAQVLTRGFNLGQSEAWELLKEFNQRCQPPWSDKDLRHKLEDASKNSRLPHGYILARSQQYEQRSSRPGYYSRPKHDDDLEDGECFAPAVSSSQRVDDFPINCFPVVLADFALEVSRSLLCPLDFPAVSMLAIASSAMGATRAVQLKRGWLECARFYIAQVAEPGSAKSPAMDMACKPIYSRQNLLDRQWREQIELYERNKEHYEATRRQRGKGQNGVPAAYLPSKPVRPTYPHLYTTDATTESLAPILSENPRGIVLIRDEISGWASGMNQYKAGGKGSDRQFWLSAWSGAAAKVDRKSAGEAGAILVPHPFVNVLGGIQPDMLSELCDERSREDGFIHRILFSYPQSNLGSRWTDAEPSPAAERAWDCCVEWLLSRDMHVNDDGTYRPHIVRLTDKAKEYWVQWHDEHAAEMRDQSFPPNLLGPWAKMRSHAARLALVVHYMHLACGEVMQEEIDHQSMSCGLTIAQYFKSHLRKAYQHLYSDQGDRLAQRVVEWVGKRGGSCTDRELVQYKFVKKASESRKLIKELADRGFGSVVWKDPATKQNARGFQLHPKSVE